MAIFILLFMPFLSDRFIYDLETHSSITTRLTLAITVVLGFLYNPFGYGFYGFYPAVSQIGMQVVTETEDYLFDSGEVIEIFSSMVALSSKSTLLDFLVLFGLFFIVFIYRLFKLVDLSDPRSRFAMAFLIISSVYTSSHDSIVMFTGMVIVLRFSKRRTHLV